MSSCTTARASGAPAREPCLVLGTAQLGLAYGIANRTGKPGADEAEALIASALRHGIGTIDTARAYGDAEARLGKLLPADAKVSIVTKLDPLDHLGPQTAEEVAVHAVNNSLLKSSLSLGRDRLDTVLLHRACNLDIAKGAVWNRLRDLRACGGIARIGVSVQTPQELARALELPDLGHVQLPFNLLDGRWARAGLTAALAARPDVTVHVRSIFLQGLIGERNPGRWPAVDGARPQAIVEFLDSIRRRAGAATLHEAALGYVRAQSFIDGIVIGMETARQVDINAALFAGPVMPADIVRAVELTRPAVPDALVNPALWPAKAAA